MSYTLITAYRCLQYLFIFIDSDPEVGKYGLESWHDFNMLCYFTAEKAQRYLVSKKTLCWELIENSHTSHGSISDLLMGKRIKSPKRWVEHGWAFIGAGFRSLLGHPTVRSTGIDTELGSVTSQLGRITCCKLQVWWCSASISLDVFSWKQLSETSRNVESYHQRKPNFDKYGRCWQHGSSRTSGVLWNFLDQGR